MYISNLLAAIEPPYVEHLTALAERLYDGRREADERERSSAVSGERGSADVRLNGKEHKIVTISAFNESV